MTNQSHEIEIVLQLVRQIAEPAEEIQNRASAIIATGEVSRPMMEALANLHISINSLFLEERAILLLSEDKP